MSFEGRVALVTGGNSGIGRAVARLFALEGAAVVVASRNEARSRKTVAEIRDAVGEDAEAPRVLAVRCDVTRAEECREAVERTVGELGRLDVLVNNAGVIVRERTVATTTPEEWDHTFGVNVRGTFLMSKYALPELARSPGGGVVVNNASYLGLVGGRGIAAYAAAKGAVVNLTRAMALDHAAEGVRVNCVCPGSVDTPMLHKEMEEMGGADRVRGAFEAKHPLGRISTPEEVARVILFLASDDARFVTGAAVPVDGGLTAG